jgi:hypothetical protein
VSSAFARRLHHNKESWFSYISSLAEADWLTLTSGEIPDPPSSKQHYYEMYIVKETACAGENGRLKRKLMIRERYSYCVFTRLNTAPFQATQIVTQGPVQTLPQLPMQASAAHAQTFVPGSTVGHVLTSSTQPAAIQALLPASAAVLTHTVAAALTPVVSTLVAPTPVLPTPLASATPFASALVPTGPKAPISGPTPMTPPMTPPGTPKPVSQQLVSQITVSQTTVAPTEWLLQQPVAVAKSERLLIADFLEAPIWEFDAVFKTKWTPEANLPLYARWSRVAIAPSQTTSCPHARSAPFATVSREAMVPSQTTSSSHARSAPFATSSREARGPSQVTSSPHARPSLAATVSREARGPSQTTSYPHARSSLAATFSREAMVPSQTISYPHARSSLPATVSREASASTKTGCFREVRFPTYGRLKLACEGGLDFEY